MSVRYSEDFKKEVVKAYMAGNKSIPRIAIDYNIWNHQYCHTWFYKKYYREI